MRGYFAVMEKVHILKWCGVVQCRVVWCGVVLKLQSKRGLGASLQRCEETFFCVRALVIVPVVADVGDVGVLLGSRIKAVAISVAAGTRTQTLRLPLLL